MRSVVSRLAGINVGHDAEIAVVFECVCAGHNRIVLNLYQR